MSNPFINADQVNAVIKVRRGPETDREQVIYEDGELVYSTDKKRLFVGDNENEGGNLVGNKVWYVDSFIKLPEIQINDLVYRTDLKAFYLLHSNNYLLSSSYALVGGSKLITDTVDTSTYVLPNATTTSKGGIIVGNGLKAVNGLLSINYDPNVFTLDITNKLTLKSTGSPPTSVSDATYVSKGIVQISNGVTFPNGGLGVNNGVISVNIDKQTIKLDSSNTLYVDPLEAIIPATTTVLGGVIVGEALNVAVDGTLDVTVDNKTIIVNALNQLEVNYPSANDGDVLTYDASTNTWGASAVSNNYTTVGNASAGIFASAVCFIPSDPGTGTWIAPAGCYTARVTIVGGGGGDGGFSGADGTRSHFNYPTGSNTAANQMFANGGTANRIGGSAGWNGVNNIAIGGNNSYFGIPEGGDGGCAAGGVGGGGGRGSDLQTGGGGSFGMGAKMLTLANLAVISGGGSGGVNGKGASGVTGGGSSTSGGGGPTLSYAAYKLSNFATAFAQSLGLGAGAIGGGAGWCSAIVSVVPGQPYPYAIGTGGVVNNPVFGVYASYGMVLIEW